MYAELHLPDELPPHRLDHYLAHGWFRMGQSIFTTNFLNFNNTFYSALWLRVSLQHMQPDAKQERLRKLNRHFGWEIKPARITPDHETLFAKYRESVPFRAAASVQQLLMGKSTDGSIYNTLEVNLFDRARRIACGYFDLGSTSAAGISSFYDPAYKKYSLGRHLIYMKMDYCRNLGLKYFYPGYFVPGYSYFDYKLTMGREALDFYHHASDTWRPIREFHVDIAPLQVMESRLQALLPILSKNNIAARFHHYDYFDGNLVPEAQGMQLFDYPVFLLLPSLATGSEQVIVYDTRSDRYRIVICNTVWSPDLPPIEDTHYHRHILRETFTLTETNTISQLLEQLTRDQTLT